MSQTRRHLLIVQLSIAKYYRQNHSGFTIPELYHFMENQNGENPVEQRTVRRCVNDLADLPFLQEKEIGNSTLYVPDPALFPQPEHSIYRESPEEVIEFHFGE